MLIATPPPAVAYPQVAGSDRTSTSSLCTLEQASRLGQRRERHRLHPLRERVTLRTGVDDCHSLQPEVSEGVADRRRHPRRVHALHLHAVELALALQDEVDLGSL